MSGSLGGTLEFARKCRTRVLLIIHSAIVRVQEVLLS